MLTCPNCGEENPERAKFCLNCGNALGRAAGSPEERKVVTILFCDLVGFTARSDKADPEDVKARLRPFHTRIKQDIEAFGGTLDKFIGDAALGVFGSPVAHEDDPERAIRAALAILEGVAQLNAADASLNLAVRVGINTGEAVVAYGTGPQIGEAVTGDVVNTASRLQGVAPVGGIVVGEPTFRATREVFVYGPLEAVTVKGKADPLAIWRVVESRGRLGQDLTRIYATPFVGRRDEREALTQAYERAVADRTAGLVAVLGEPGAGKSRLVFELGRHLDTATELVTWRRGRCLPYGEGITFWALGEIVKAHAGILESDSPEEAAAKLDGVVPYDEPDRQWMKQRLAPLVGAEASSVAEREESFTAWRRFLQSVARANPAVFVFDDIHWADDALLAFLEHLAGASRGSPMLVVCTARPELLDRHPTWAQEIPGAVRIDLGPLSAQETASLVSGMLETSVLPAEVQALVLDRAGGNPLYAEEFVRMLKERGVLVTKGRTVGLADGAEIPSPESIQALIAARLDAVGPERKSILQDAAVMGRVFWSGALSEMGGRDESHVAEALEDLATRRLVRPEATSAIGGQAEYSFSHSLVRDVAYGQIPRAGRAARHLGAAAWIERQVAGRVENHAEVLAHHYTQALELSRAAGERGNDQDLLAAALRYLVLAGDHALGLDVSQARIHYAKALDLVPSTHALRPEILVGWADAVRQAGGFPEAAASLEEAIQALRDGGDRVGAARALGTLSSVYLAMGDRRQVDVAAEAVELLEDEAPGPDLVAAYARMAGTSVVLGDQRKTIEWADRATALATDIGSDVPARALGFRGFARCSLGDAEGLADIRAALQLAVDRGEGRDAAVQYNNLAVALWPVEGPASVMETLREGIEFSERRGIREFSLTMSAAALDQLFELGRWDDVIERSTTFDPEAEAAGDIATLLQVRWARARVLAARGEVADADELAEWLVTTARDSGGVEDLVAGLGCAAFIYGAAGENGRSRDLLSEIDAVPNVRESAPYPAYLPGLVRAAIVVGDPSLAERLVAGVKPMFPYRQHALAASRALLAEASGQTAEAAHRHAMAAERWSAFSVVPERAFALLGQGRCEVELRRPEAREALLAARGIFVELNGRPVIAECDRLLERAIAASS